MQQPKKWSVEQQKLGLDKAARRKAAQLKRWEEERARYQDYVSRLKALLALEVSGKEPLKAKIDDLIPANSLGDGNTAADILHYVVGASAGGLAVDTQGNLDEGASFRHVDYFSLFSRQVVRNNPQPGISPRPIDFAAITLPAEEVAARLGEDALKISQGILLYGDERHQLIELVSRHEGRMRIRLIPAAQIQAYENGKLSWQPQQWGADFPLHLYEDQKLELPDGAGRARWLSQWHTEQEWFQAIYKCRYSNGVIGITEELLPPSQALPKDDENSAVGRLELRRRQLVQPDFHLFAADHWNFNVRQLQSGRKSR